jgi:hypothetical protein
MLIIADAGIPILCLQVPAAVLLIFPVVCIEAVVVAKVVCRSFRTVFGAVFIANLFSFFVGLPLAWFVMWLIQCVASICNVTDFHYTGWKGIATVALQSAWVPGEGGPDWIIPAAFLVLIVPYFFVSVMTERWLMGKRLREAPSPQIRRAAWLANLASYTGLALWAAYGVYCNIPSHVGSS